MIFSAPPRWTFHAALILTIGCLIWAYSLPGVSLVLQLVGFLALMALGVLWLGKLVGAWRQYSGWSWWFALAPILVIGLSAMLHSRFPLQARWELSLPAFENLITDMPSDGKLSVDTPTMIGSYTITSTFRVPEGVLFYEETGSSFVDDAGFAYLPGGPTNSLANSNFESPTFYHLGGSWYSWTASW